MQIDEMIAVLQAAKEGKTIQDSLSNDAWYDNPDPTWNFQQLKYRVKPEPVKVELSVIAGSFGWEVTGFGNPNLELTFEEGKLTGARVL